MIRWIYGIQDDHWYTFDEKSKTCYVVAHDSLGYFYEYCNSKEYKRVKCENFNDGKNKVEEFILNVQD